MRALRLSCFLLYACTCFVLQLFGHSLAHGAHFLTVIQYTRPGCRIFTRLECRNITKGKRGSGILFTVTAWMWTLQEKERLSLHHHRNSVSSGQRKLKWCDAPLHFTSSLLLPAQECKPPMSALSLAKNPLIWIQVLLTIPYPCYTWCASVFKNHFCGVRAFLLLLQCLLIDV